MQNRLHFNDSNGCADTAAKTTVLADEHIKAAGSSINRGDLEGCIASLRSAAEAEPGNGKIMATLGNAYLQLGDFKAARAQFEQLVRIEPQNAMLYVQLATACHRLGDIQGLTAGLTRALAIDPGCEAALTLLATVHFQARRYEDAANVYEHLAARQPNKVGWALALIKCRYHLGNLRGCQELAERVLRIEPGNPQALEALALVRNATGAPRSATVADIVRENPALHRDHTGKALTMPISGGIAGFIERFVNEQSRTIETGAGMSTLCFLVKGARHTAIAPDASLETRLREYCRTHGMDDGRLAYIPKTSQDAVWAIEGEFDCALIDGGHGFPIPFIDFFYLNRHLKKGGYLIIDDLEIWTGETLAKFLSCERAWKLVAQDGHRAIIFQKVGDAHPSEWNCQEFVVKSSLHPTYMEEIMPREIFSPAAIR